MLSRLPIVLLALAATAFAGAAALAFQLAVEPDQNNVSAGRLFGHWEADPVVAERMGLPPSSETLEFAPDESFLASIPAEMAEALAKLRVFESGIVTIRREGRLTSSGPYILTTVSGNPHLVMFRDRDGEALADAESSNVFVAPGKTREQDLLLLGGDFNNEPFRAFRRVKSE